MDDETSRTLFFELFDGLPRQGPGNLESTRHALSLIPPLNAASHILDVGCGTGAQTLDLAQLTSAQITAVDIHAPFIDTLNGEAHRLGLGDRVHAQVADMESLDFPSRHFDVIWSEGALYFMGFDTGLRTLRPFLKDNGHVAVTELCWLTDNPPEECARYFEEAYPAMRSIRANKAGADGSGYGNVAHFVLPAHAWWDDYYTPLQNNLISFRANHKGNADAQSIAEETDREIEMFSRFHEHYGYVFFVMRKRRN